MEWLNNKRDILLAKINVLSENILKHMYYYAGYNLKYSMKHREKIKQQENKKRYVYYHEYNFFNILLLVYALIEVVQLLGYLNSETAISL